MPTGMPPVNRLIPGLVEGIDRPSVADAGGGADTRAEFSELFANLVNSVNELQTESAEAQRSLMAGEPIELHEVMIKGEEAGLAMDLLLEIRGRIVEGYKEIMRMPM
ncbi:MAG: flagellar hook-basal body complex protein FliE [Candidatus Zixiibacteriota bacterium]|nr:MAG: flagellar hook-basal body complex protein FliE [candidate division Zixibacteria bacterium]